MSTQNRKISYWSIDFVDKDDNRFFSEDIFCRFMAYIRSLKMQELLFRDEKQYKAVSVESIEKKDKQGKKIYRVIFKSCKYNHSPNYMSSLDGTERPTDKLRTEGDKELTHMCVRVDENEAFTVFEERRSGVTLGAVIKYFNHLFEMYAQAEGIDKSYVLQQSVIPSEDFLSALDRTNRITVAEVFVKKEFIGTEFLGLVDTDDQTQNDLTITIKAKPRQSLKKRTVRALYERVMTAGAEVKRVRIRGKDAEKMSIVIDSLNGKKVLETTVDLLDSGIVDSTSILKKMEDLLKV